MNYKVLLLDYDGIFYTGKYFSEIYCEEFGVDIQKVRKFMDGPKVKANMGKVDLKNLLKDVLGEWGWKGTVDELVDYWLKSDCAIDQRMVAFTNDCRKKVKVYIASDQEKYKADFIWNEVGLKNCMDGKFMSCEMGLIKRDTEFFRSVLRSLPNIKPEQIIYFDDSNSKISAAKEVGLDARLYTNYESLVKVINKLL